MAGLTGRMNGNLYKTQLKSKQHLVPAFPSDCVNQLSFEGAKTHLNARTRQLQVEKSADFNKNLRLR